MITLTYSNRNLTILPELPLNLQELDCSRNQLTALPRLPPELQQLHCFNNQLTQLPELPPSKRGQSKRGLQKLYCSFNLLTSLPNLLSTLQRFYCGGNRFLWKSRENKKFKVSLYFSNFKVLHKVQNNIKNNKIVKTIVCTDIWSLVTRLGR